MSRASRGRLERPSSWREVKGTSGSGFATASRLEVAGSEGGGVEMWPFAIGGEAMVCQYLRVVVAGLGQHGV